MARTTFYRPVRSYPDPLPTETLKIEPPPAQPAKQGGASALVQLLYPLSGCLMSGLFIFGSFSSGQHLSPLLLIGEASFIPLSVGVMLLANFLQQRGTKQKIKADRAAYKSYLEDKERYMAAIAKVQQYNSQRLYPDLSALLDVVTRRQFLWERRPADPDFLTLRVGRAPAPLACSVDFREDFRVNYDTELLFSARALTTGKRYLDQLPVTIPFPRLGTLAIRGNPTHTHNLLRFLLCQVAAFHSPNEIRVLGYFQPRTASEWSWLKWLPHTRRLRPIKSNNLDGEQFCMLANAVTDFQEILLTQIKPEIERRNKINLEQRGSDKSPRQHTPHLLVLLDGFDPTSALADVAGLEDLLLNSIRLGVTVLCLVEHARQEPAMIQARLLLNSVADSTQLQYSETAPGGLDIEFIQPDTADISTCEQIARSLAPLQLIDSEAELDFTQEIRLLTLHNLPSVDALNVMQHWRAHSDAQLLSAPIGQQKHGPLYLDLKEMAVGGFGPHGMVVGGTGSGKSELLRTVVTSLALTHDPQTVNFVLVDFKAGAAFADFEQLPHVAGMITNLENDPLQINRMHASLLGEQNRRQAMLSNAGNLSNIRQYQARRQRNPSMEPMPYLLIIVDEFAQLIATHDEFLALFTKFGQVGRSLGMHMMLATQRIDEGRIKALDGHLRYRICLRTFKPEESIAVISKPDAYYLPPLPGSGYFKVDEDLYTAFKTALISTPYVSQQDQQIDPVTLIREFTPTGKLVETHHKPAATVVANAGDEPPTEMSMVVRRVQEVTPPPGGWRVHAVWRPPLKENMPLAEVLQRCGQTQLDGSRWVTPPPFGPLIIPIGLLDRPTAQAQEPALLDFSGIGGHLAIVGAPQSGKSTLLRTIMTSFLITHTPQEVQLYAIDLGGGLLRVFDNAPHVGAVCGKTERDKIRRVIRRIRQVLVEREQLFSEKGIDSMTTYRQLRRDNILPNETFGDVFLFVDNFALLQNEFENTDPDIIADIATFIANGLTYGVHVILTANQWLEIRARQRSNIGSRLELRLNDPTESDIDRRLAQVIPVEAAGRGVHQLKLMFQTALPIVNAADAATIQPLETLIQRVRTSWKGPRAPQILVLPTEISLQDIPVPTPTPAGVPIGLEELQVSPQYIDLINRDPHFLILGDRECGKTTLLRTWIRGIERQYTPDQAKIILVDYRKTLLAMSKSTHVAQYLFMPDQLKAWIQDFKKELEQRIEANQALPVDQLQTPQPWPGTHYIILVDDYETVSTQDPRMGNPLNPLEGFMQSAHDIGFHLVLARRVTSFGTTNMDPTFRSIKNMESPGLLMRGDPSEGRQALHKQSVSDAFPPGRGVLVRRGFPPTLVQVASS